MTITLFRIPHSSHFKICLPWPNSTVQRSVLKQHMTYTFARDPRRRKCASSSAR
jgi:hypothetical protein